MDAKKIVSFLILILFSGLACKGSLDLGISEPTLTPTLTMALTSTPTPHPTFTPTPEFRVIPSNYYRITTRKLTMYKSGKEELICIYTNTHRIEKMLEDEIAEVISTTTVQPILGDCAYLETSAINYQINVYTGKLIEQGTLNESWSFLGKDFQGSEDDIFRLSDAPIPVWKMTYPRTQDNGAWKGIDEVLIDKATGICIYLKRSITNVDDARFTATDEYINLITNAPIGGLLNTEFSYKKK